MLVLLYVQNKTVICTLTFVQTSKQESYHAVEPEAENKQEMISFEFK